MPHKLRIGIIGLGKVARAHLRAYQDLVDEVDLAAAAEPDPTRLRETAKLYGFRPYAECLKMLKGEKLDLAIVLTPASTHAEITISCAEAGVHVLCEKPLAISLEAAEHMIAACQERRVRLCYGASYRFLPAIQKARELIQTGVIGDVLILREHLVGGEGPESHQGMDCVHYPKGGPGGSGMGLVDHGIHCIDTFAWLVNCDIESVFGQGNISGEQPKTECAHMNFQNGAVGQLLYNDGTFPTELPQEGIFSWGEGWDLNGLVMPGQWQANPGCIHVHGTKGALRIFYYANALFVVTKSGTSQVPLTGRAAPAHFARQLRAFINDIQRNCESEVPGEIGLQALRVLLATYESANTGKLVTVRKCSRIHLSPARSERCEVPKA